MLTKLSYTPSVAFMIMIYKEAPALVDYCLRKLRESYTDSPVVLIYDGKAPTEEELESSRFYGALIFYGDRLKFDVSKGAAIWHRLFTLGLQFSAEYIVKMDPDTRVHTPVTLWPTGMEVAGTVMSPGTTAQHIQGGFQIFPQHAAEMLHGISDLDIWRDPESWKMGQSYVFTAKNMISTDYTLAAMMNHIDIRFIDHPELDCRSLAPKPDGVQFRSASVTHPHKNPLVN